MSPRRRAPALVVVVELEQRPAVRLVAETAEDELRLRAWLRRSTSFAPLPWLLQQLLDDLDEADRRSAA